jgi:benzoyl-CoA reductase/2-hydroxyglutaryl-CoA dehydratase subunit BcrC/BadD/HgdB
MGEAIDFGHLAGPMENDHIKEWKAAGGRVVGFFCSHAPEELLWAAGILPVRMRGTGSDETSCADQYLASFNCSFVRHTLDRVMRGALAFLDGLLITNSCDHIRRLFDICVTRDAAPFCHYMDVPLVNSADSLARLTDELNGFKERLELFFDVTITEEKLRDALTLYNRTRALLDRASALRAEDPPRATGSEVLAMSVAAASMPKDRFNSLLERRLEQLERDSAPAGIKRRRLLIIGGMLDDPGYVEVIESLGAAVVADQLCCGAKTFANQADEGIDPIQAIAKRMLEHLPCPRMVGDYPKRLASVVNAVTEHRVEGIVCERLKFCDLWGGEVQMLRRSAKTDLQVPLLVLERDYLTAGGIGQLRTRVQAFLESLG